MVGPLRRGRENKSLILTTPINSMTGPDNQETALIRTKKNNLTGNICETNPAAKAIPNQRKGRSVTSAFSSAKPFSHCSLTSSSDLVRSWSGRNEISDCDISIGLKKVEK